MNTRKSSVRLATYTTVHSAIDRLGNDGEKKWRYSCILKKCHPHPPSGPIWRDPGRAMRRGTRIAKAPLESHRNHWTDLGQPVQSITGMVFPVIKSLSELLHLFGAATLPARPTLAV